jgi:hypothetical protein
MVEENKVEGSIKDSEDALNIMANQEFRDDFSNLIRTRWPLFYITTNEEKRLLSFLKHYCIVNGHECCVWDVFRGLIDIVSNKQVEATSDDIKNPIRILEYIVDESQPIITEEKGNQRGDKRTTTGVIYVLLDYFRFIELSPPDPDIERRLKAVAGLNGVVTTIVTGPYYRSTDVIENLMPLVDFPYPNNEELKQSLLEVTRGKSVQTGIPDINDKTAAVEDDLIASVSGLTLSEAQTAFSKSLVKHHDWNIKTILKEKRQIINKSGSLEYFDKTVSLEEVGGLKKLKHWIKIRKPCFSKEAREYGLEKPRGLLTIGMPGCVLANTKIRVKKISNKGKYKIYKK